MSDEDDVHSSDVCRTLPRPNQPESFVTLMGEHFVDSSVSGQLIPQSPTELTSQRLEYVAPSQDHFQRPSRDRAHETIQRPQQDYQQVQSLHQTPQTTYSQQEVEYMHVQFKMKSRIQELEYGRIVILTSVLIRLFPSRLLLRMKTEECERANENEKYWRYV
jgi:hypothetical protein